MMSVVLFITVMLARLKLASTISSNLSDCISICESQVYEIVTTDAWVMHSVDTGNLWHIKIIDDYPSILLMSYSSHSTIQLNWRTMTIEETQNCSDMSLLKLKEHPSLKRCFIIASQHKDIFLVLQRGGKLLAINGSLANELLNVQNLRCFTPKRMLTTSFNPVGCDESVFMPRQSSQHVVINPRKTALIPKNLSTGTSYSALGNTGAMWYNSHVSSTKKIWSPGATIKPRETTQKEVNAMVIPGRTIYTPGSVFIASTTTSERDYAILNKSLAIKTKLLLVPTTKWHSNSTITNVRRVKLKTKSVIFHHNTKYLLHHSFCARSVILYTLGTSSPQPAKIGYKYDFELRLTTNDIGTYSGMNFSANTPQEVAAPPVQNRFCRTPTMSSSGSISAASATWYGTAFDGSDVLSYISMSVTSSQTVTGSATVSFWFSMMPVVSTSTAAPYSMTWALGFYYNGVWQNYQGSLPINFFGPENVASLQDSYILATLIGDPVKQLNETTIATYKIYVDHISPNITIIASWWHPNFKHGMSIQGINLYTNWGAFWKCSMHYPPYNYFVPQYEPNDAELGNKKAYAYFGVQSNSGSRANSVTNIGNYLEFQITVHWYGYDKTINNSTYTLYVATVIDGVVMDNSSHNFPLSGYYPPGAITTPLVLNSRALNPKVPLGGLAAANASVTLPAFILTDFSVSVTPNSEYLEAIYIQQGPRGFDIPNMLAYPELTTVEYFTRNNIKCARLQLGYILVSGQVYWSTTEDYISVLVTVRIDPTATSLINQNVSATIILEYNNAGTMKQITAVQSWTVVPAVVQGTVTENVTSYFGKYTFTANSMSTRRTAMFLDGVINYPTNGYARLPLMNLEAYGQQFNICEMRIISGDTNFPGISQLVNSGDQTTTYKNSSASISADPSALFPIPFWPTSARTFQARAILEPYSSLSSGPYSVNYYATFDNASANAGQSLIVEHISSAACSLDPSQVKLMVHLRSFTANNLYNGESGVLMIRIKFAPQQCGPFSISTSLSNELQFCSVEIYPGENLPCLGTVLPVISGQSLTINFGVITNVGLFPAFDSRENDDENTILVAASVTAQSVTSSKSANVKVWDNLGHSTGIVIYENASNFVTYGLPPNIVYFGPSFENTTNITVNVVYHYQLQISIPRFSMQPVTVAVYPPLSISGDSIRFMGAFVTSIGSNFPCVNNTMNSTMAAINNSNYMNFFQINLGPICQAEVAQYWNTEFTDNTFLIEFTFLLLQSSSISQAMNTIFPLTAMVNSVRAQINLTVSATTQFLNLKSDMSLLNIVADNSTLTDKVIPGSYNYKVFNVTIPPNSAGFAKVKLTSSFGNGTGGLHISNLSLVYNGRNIQCLSDSEIVKTYNSTIVPPISYNDVASLGMWLDNTGYTYRTKGGPLTGDDLLSFQVTYMMTDNPLATANYTWYINFNLEYSNVILNSSHPVLTERTGAENTVLDFAVNYSVNFNATTICTAGQNISVLIGLAHEPASSAEAYNVSVTLYSPQTMSILIQQPTISYPYLTVNHYAFGMQLFYPRLLFLDVLNVILNLQLDAFSVEATVPTILAVKIPFQMEYFLFDRTIAIPSMLRKVTPLQYLSLNFTATGISCQEELTTSSALLNVYVSSTLNYSYPAYAKFDSTNNFWNPLIRPGAQEFVEYCFSSGVTVSSLMIRSCENCRRPTQLLIAVIETNATAWRNTTIMNLVYATKQLQTTANLNPPISNILAIRLTILGADLLNEVQSTYMGMKVGLTGCRGNTTAWSSCIIPKPTDTWGARYFAETINSEISACFYNPKKQQRLCYESIDGETWSEFDEESMTVLLDVQNASADTKYVPYVASGDNFFNVLATDHFYAKFDGLYRRTIDKIILSWNYE